MYAAKTYIGQVAAPGEILPESIPEETIQWLKEAGAIREIAPDPPVRSAAPDGQDEPHGDAPGGEPAQRAPQDVQSAPQDGQGAGADAQNADSAEDSAQEPCEDEEAPEIDVMAGIVSGAGEGKKAAEKRTAARRKSK